MRDNIGVSTDCVIVGPGQRLLLVKRKNDPYKGYWSLPGGFLHSEESLEKGAARELEEETGVQVDQLHQIGAFGKPDRDPRGRTISIAFFGRTQNEAPLEASDDAADAQWFPLDKLPELGFDHAEIVKQAKKKFNIKQG